MTAFWPDNELRQASHRLGQALVKLRKALDGYKVPRPFLVPEANGKRLKDRVTTTIRNLLCYHVW